MISSYGSPINLGSKYLENLFDGPVVIQEKVDGSQISFGVIEGELCVRSRSQEVTNDKTGMFAKGVAELRKIEHLLPESVIYRGEYLQKPRHNKLAYGRVPDRNIILYDIEWADGAYANPAEIEEESMRIGLEYVPCYYWDTAEPTEEFLKEFLENESILGGTKIEGIVIKNYTYQDQHSKTLMGKLVSDAFRESMSVKTPKIKADAVTDIMETYNLEARWSKAVQHLKEQGELEGSPKDIGKLIAELNQDFEKEEADTIKELLWAHYRKQFLREVSNGFAQWYKNELAFGEDR